VKYTKETKIQKEVKDIKEKSQMALQSAWNFDIFHKQLGHQ
jgi:hypothetical protein